MSLNPNQNRAFSGSLKRPISAVRWTRIKVPRSNFNLDSCPSPEILIRFSGAPFCPLTVPFSNQGNHFQHLFPSFPHMTKLAGKEIQPSLNKSRSSTFNKAVMSFSKIKSFLIFSKTVQFFFFFFPNCPARKSFSQMPIQWAHLDPWEYDSATLWGLLAFQDSERQRKLSFMDIHEVYFWTQTLPFLLQV